MPTAREILDRGLVPRDKEQLPPTNTLPPAALTNQAQQPVASYQPDGGERVTFACLVDDLDEGQRLVRNVRPYRGGAKLDSTGLREKVWKVLAVFNNSLKEPGLDLTVPPYPDGYHKLVNALRLQVVGNLITPTDGLVRARPETWQRTTPEDSTDEIRLAITFVEDNEDAVGRGSFTRPTVFGRVKVLTELTRFSMIADDEWSDPLLQLRELASQVEGLMLAPGRAVEDLVTRAEITRSTFARVIATAETAARLEREDGTRPPSFRGHVAASQATDSLAAAAAERQASLPATVDVKVRETTDAFALAAKYKQPVAAVLDLNPKIEDAFRVPPGNYKVYARWPA